MSNAMNLDWSAMLAHPDEQKEATTNAGTTGNALVSGEAIETRHDATQRPGEPPAPLPVAATAPKPYPPDDRRWCRDCQRLAGGVRCKAPAAGLLIASKVYEPVQTMPRRCVAYLPCMDDPDQTPGAARWPVRAVEDRQPPGWDTGAAAMRGTAAVNCRQ